ncbi:MAG TPA: hypothetical protein VF003_11030 [Pseudonocardiaceae bacterium]
MAAGCGVRLAPALSVDADVGCGLVTEAAGALVAGAGCGAVGAVAGVPVVAGAPVVAFDALNDWCATCPRTGWAPALCAVLGAAVGVVAPVVPPGSAERSALVSPPWWTSDPLLVELPKSGVGAWLPDVPGTVEPRAAGWAGAGLDAPVHDGFAAVLDPALC